MCGCLSLGACPSGACRTGLPGDALEASGLRTSQRGALAKEPWRWQDTGTGDARRAVGVSALLKEDPAPPGRGPRRSRRPRLNGRKVILSRKEILSVPILRTAPLSGTQEFSCLFLLSYFHSVMKHINQKGSNIVFFKLLVSANWNIRFAEI